MFTHYLHTIYTVSIHYLHYISSVYTLSTHYLHYISSVYTLSTHYLYSIYTVSIQYLCLHIIYSIYTLPTTVSTSTVSTGHFHHYLPIYHAASCWSSSDRRMVPRTFLHQHNYWSWWGSLGLWCSSWERVNLYFQLSFDFWFFGCTVNEYKSTQKTYIQEHVNQGSCLN